MVSAWKETIIIPTYEVGEPEKYPLFLEKRVYQGGTGSVYPHPVIEKIQDDKIDKEWEVVYLENDYLKIMIIPDLGGRIHMAYDKIKERHFVYYNEVIKPALVGLTGPWISGGIEFNWPQHHRPSTFNPIDCHIEENQDGSKTVWVNEVERMFRTKGMAGFTLYPDKAYLEVKGQLFNRTPHPQTFLWWANPAVAATDFFQSVFPPDVYAVFDHGKRDVSKFPIATGNYYKVDYSAGVDISRYKNIPVPTSFMAIESKYDFVGGYEHDTKSGLMHIADHHISPGKKLWTWGKGDFGKAWDRNLTDENGPYVELMCGVYTDNQPDFSWIQPYEERKFKQYFMPYQHVGMVKNASKEALINLELQEVYAEIKVYVTAEYPNAQIKLESSNQIFLDERMDLRPQDSFVDSVFIGDILLHELTLSVFDAKGKLLISWEPEKEELKAVPEAAQAAKMPEEILNTEQLYLRGLHLEQYRHATYDPTSYYLEALKRDPEDIRNNNAMGLWYMKRAKFKAAEISFKRAINTMIDKNPNPYDGEPYFNLGQALKFQGKFDEAYDAFYKGCWNAGWQDAGYFNLARIDCRRGDFEQALEHVEKSLIRNWHNHQARHLKIVLLRKLNRQEEALLCIEDSLKIDRFGYGIIYEKNLITKEASVEKNLISLMRDDVHSYIEYSLDYVHAGLYEEAISFLSIYVKNKDKIYPMVHYLLGWNYNEVGKVELAKKYFSKAMQMPTDYCFPNRLEEVLALQCAIQLNSQDSHAHYYLGNFWYAFKQYNDALESWEYSREVKADFSIVHRNLALIYYNQLGKQDEALQALTKAFELDSQNPRVLMELDQLYKKINKPPGDRRQLLKANLLLVEFRDDLYLELVTLFNMNKQYELALKWLMRRNFHPWEGGEGKVPKQYLTSHIELSKIYIEKGIYDKALDHLNKCGQYPHNLGEGKLAGVQENDIYYWKGCVYEKLGAISRAKDCWIKASIGVTEPSQATFYNDQQPDKIFYQGLALRKLGLIDEAKSRFNKLIDYAEKQLFVKVSIDYFAVSLPDLLVWNEDLQLRNAINCHYLIGLGELGLGNLKRAEEEFDWVLKKDLYHMGASIYKQSIKISEFQ